MKCDIPYQIQYQPWLNHLTIGIFFLTKTLSKLFNIFLNMKGIVSGWEWVMNTLMLIDTPNKEGSKKVWAHVCMRDSSQTRGTSWSRVGVKWNMLKQKISSEAHYIFFQVMNSNLTGSDRKTGRRFKPVEL